jgi:hypothetical protein
MVLAEGNVFQNVKTPVESGRAGKLFASPSAAAACVLGRNSNGRLDWKVADTRMTFGEWQESLLDAVTDEMLERE